MNNIKSRNGIIGPKAAQYAPNFWAHTERAVSMWQKNCWLDCHALAGWAVTALLSTVKKLRTAGPVWGRGGEEVEVDGEEGGGEDGEDLH